VRFVLSLRPALIVSGAQQFTKLSAKAAQCTAIVITRTAATAHRLQSQRQYAVQDSTGRN